MARRLRIAALAMAIVLALGYLAASMGLGLADRPIGHVVYLSATPSGGHLAPAALEQHFESLGYRYDQVVSWKALLGPGAENIAALILDSGSVTLVDEDWVRMRYRGGMVVAGINVDAVTLQILLADPEITAEYEMSVYAPPAGEYWSAGYRGIRGTPFALTAIAQDPSLMEGGLPDEETATQWFSFDMEPASGRVGRRSVDLTAVFYDQIASGISEAMGVDPAHRAPGSPASAGEPPEDPLVGVLPRDYEPPVPAGPTAVTEQLPYPGPTPSIDADSAVEDRPLLPGAVDTPRP